MKKESRLKYFPITLFPMVMGLSGLALAWRQAGQILPLKFNPQEMIALLAVTIFILLSLAYLTKLVRFRESVITELKHPVKANFFPTTSISIVLLAALSMPYSESLAKWLFIVGALLHLALTFWVFNSWIFSHHHQNEHINPAWFIPVVGNVLMPIVAVPLGMEEVGWFFYSIGIVFWIVLFTIFMHRIFFFDPLPPGLMPTLFILIAPPAVGFISYLELNGYVDNFAQILYGVALFITLFLFSQFRRFTSLPFFLSWWAYSFPLAAITIASFRCYEQTQYMPVRWIALCLLGLISALIISLFVRTFLAMAKKQICVPDS
jgi:tellurite resistance protein